jgi:hypothetical protein
VPAIVQTAVQAKGRTTRTAIAVVVYALDYDPNGTLFATGDYWFDAVTVDTTTKQLAKVCGIVSDLRSFYTWVTEWVLGYDVSGTLGASPPYFGAGDSHILFGGDKFSPTVVDSYDPADWVAGKFSMPRGQRFNFSATANTASIGTGGTTFNLGSGYILRSGRTYRAKIGGGCATSTGTVRMGTDLTCTFSGGSVQFWGDGWFGPQVGSQNLPIHYESIRRNAGVDRTITATNLFILSSAGTVTWNGASGLNRWVSIEDVGSNNDWVGYPSF